MPPAQERGWKYLQPLKSDRSPSSFLFLDTETYQIPNSDLPSGLSHKFRLAVVRYVRIVKGEIVSSQYHRSNTVKDCWDWIVSKLEKRKSTWLFAHNLGFDLTTLDFWSHIETGDFTWNLRTLKSGESEDSEDAVWSEQQGYVVLEDPPTILSGWFLAKKIVMVDWLNYFRQTLASIGDSVGIEKLALPEECDSEEDWFLRCERDVEILSESVIRTVKLWRSEQCGSWGPTAPSLAWNYFRRRHLEKDTILIHGDAEALAYERHSYYGGQVVNGWVGEVIDDGGIDGSVDECQFDGMFRRSGRVYCLDVNSLYPSVMASSPMPVKLLGKFPGDIVEKAIANNEEYICVAFVRVINYHCDLPVRVDNDTTQPILREDTDLLACPVSKHHRTLYAGGRYWTVLAGEELRQAYLSGHIDRIRDGMIYLKGEPFGSCVAELWDRKMQAEGSQDLTSRAFWKLILNSLSGKFGQRGSKWVDLPNEPPVVLWGHWIRGNYADGVYKTYRSIGGWTQRRDDDIEGRYSNPAISATITAGGRERMRQLRKIAGQREVYYQDTDSLHVTESGYSDLLDAGQVGGDQLGQLRLEGTFQHARYFGQKVYSLEGNWTVAGITPAAIQLGYNCWAQREFSRLQSVLASDPSGGIVSWETSKRLGELRLSGELEDRGFVLPCRVFVL